MDKWPFERPCKSYIQSVNSVISMDKITTLRLLRSSLTRRNDNIKDMPRYNNWINEIPRWWGRSINLRLHILREVSLEYYWVKEIWAQNES
jgi:hypothetical protein